MTAMDGRTAAWLQAWHRLDHADDLKHEAVSKGSELPPEYWGIIAEADVFSRLATAPGDVGYIAGDSLEAKYQAEQEAEKLKNKQMRDILDHRKPSDDDVLSCTCGWDESQCPIHNEGDEMDDDEESPAS